MSFDLDAIDLKLLGIVQEDASLTAAELSRRAPLSPSAVQRRLNRLRDIGVIEREAAVLSAAYLQGRVTGVVHVQMAGHEPGAVAALLEHVAARPQVQMLFEISGGYDLMLVVIEQNLHAFNAFTAEVLGRHENVKRYETTFVKNRVKATLAVPIG